MDAFNASFHVVIPIYLLVLVGYLSGRAGVFSDTTLKEMNNSVFRLFLPMLLFENMYTSDIQVSDVGVVIYAVATVFVIYGLCNIVVPLFHRDKSRTSTMIQGMYRSNFALMGIALTETYYGNGNTQITGMLVAIVIPIYNVLAVVLFERYRNEGRTNIGSVLLGIAKNPLIIGTMMGLLVNVLDFKVPNIINSGIVTLGQIATPLALVVMGASFEFSQTIINRVDLLAVISVRLLLIPIVFTLIAVLIGYRERALYALFVMYATPTAVASYAMASAMDGEEKLAGEIVLLTTVLSVVSIGVGVFVLKSTELI